MAVAGFGAFAASASRAWALDAIENPLAHYPSRDWERTYRDLWKTDSAFTFLCAPNDTHNCILEAQVRSGVMVRIGPTMRYGEATDIYGNRASHRWDPRTCQKGLALTRRFYGDRRVRHCRVREGVQALGRRRIPARRGWKTSGSEYLNRARDEWVRVTHEEAASVVAATLKNIAETYSGEEGMKRLRAQGYMEETIAATGGAGTQVLKFRGGMPLLGMTRIFGHYRMANSMALLDAPDPRRRPRRGPRRPRLRQLLVAHGPPSRSPDGHRPADGRLGSQLDRACAARRHLGHELDLHEDARRSLAHRGAPQRDQDRRHRPASTRRRPARGTKSSCAAPA